MIHPQALIRLFGYTAELILRQTETLSHPQSLQQPAPEQNGINWLLGHIISSRMRALVLLGEPEIWDAARRAPYRSGAPLLTAEHRGVLLLATLIADFRTSQERLITGLERADDAVLCRPSGYRSNTIGESLAYVHFHEAHHVGQILYVAPLVGVPAVWLEA